MQSPSWGPRKGATPPSLYTTTTYTGKGNAESGEPTRLGQLYPGGVIDDLYPYLTLVSLPRLLLCTRGLNWNGSWRLRKLLVTCSRYLYRKLQEIDYLIICSGGCAIDSFTYTVGYSCVTFRKFSPFNWLNSRDTLSYYWRTIKYFDNLLVKNIIKIR